MMKMAQKKKQIVERTKDRIEMKEEEKLAQQNVKTIIDKDAAEMERQRIAERR